MVISGGNFRPDTLKPKEVVSLLLDDDEMERKSKLNISQLCKTHRIMEPKYYIFKEETYYRFTMQCKINQLNKKNTVCQSIM